MIPFINAIYGIPVFFGSKYQHFKEANDLVKVGCAFSVADYDSFFSEFNRVVNDQALMEIIRKKSNDYINKKCGATGIIMNYLRMNYNF